MIYCIDSHTFTWAVKEQADNHDIYRLEQAQHLVKWFKKNNHIAMVPTIVLAECLIREPEIEHQKIIENANKSFMVVNFDTRCAMKYGELLRLDKWDDAKNLAKENKVRRDKMKLDHMILACAIVNGADGIFTEDRHFTNFIGDKLKILTMDLIATQMKLIV